MTEYHTQGVNKDNTPKHVYPESEWVLVPLGHWNWKWNSACANYCTYEQELWAGMLVLSSQHRVIGGNPVVWLCDQEPIKSFQNGIPPKKAQLRPWWTYWSQLHLNVYHIQGIKNENANFIGRNNLDELIGASSQAIAREAFARMDAHLDLSLQQLPESLQDLKFEQYGKEFSDDQPKVQAQLESVIIDKEPWPKEKKYTYYEDRMVLPKERFLGVVKWSHAMRGHAAARESLPEFNKWFHTTMGPKESMELMQSITDACPCKGSNQCDSRDPGL